MEQTKETRAQIGYRNHSHRPSLFAPIHQPALGHEPAAALNTGGRREVTYGDFWIVESAYAFG